MPKLGDWCGATDTKVKGHELRVLEPKAASFDKGVAALAAVVPGHYAGKKRVAKLLTKLGKKAAATYISEKLPESKKIRSGDLGEILGATYVDEYTTYQMSVNKLRWKDHRNMSMRGDDLVGIEATPAPEKIRFLKGEVKSAAKLSAATATKAREGLMSYRSRPSPHALEFIADRLHDEGEDALADLLDEAILVDGIKLSQVEHLLFTFSGNDPTDILKTNVEGYIGKVKASKEGPGETAE